MNRIILIGNGFDLAHGLKTSYVDFIRGYYIAIKYRLLKGEFELNDGLCSVKISDSEDRKLMEKFRWMLSNNMFRYVNNVGEITLTERYDTFFNDHSKYESRFFEAINKAVETKNWVDIENEFYLWLKKIFKKDNCEYDSPVPLNKELELIKERLVEYLKFIQENQIKPELVEDCIREAIYEPFRACDISTNEYNKFNLFLKNRWENGDYRAEEKCKQILLKYGLPQDTGEIARYVSYRSIKQHIYDIYNGGNDIHPYFLLPDNILFLNFNYTSTANLYIPEGLEFKINHIHGELNNEKNPIIFGYGDELDDDYKEIAKLNDNEYLKNIKSIRYLETDNYRKLLSFIDSAPFQIYIMGHSCGNSDRTLLNTLFEHRNCVSIKPFYYEKPDGTDNYIEIVQNISRNFNDMRLMRDRVVNKTYCRPLVASKE